MSIEVYNIIDIDLKVCSNIYGQSPCTATGTHCFNTYKTCQDKPNFTASSSTLRLGDGGRDLPIEWGAISNIVSVNYTPSIVELGKSIGTRSKLVVTCTDHRTPDTGAAGDPYLSVRNYDKPPYEFGTFLGRFKARQPYLRGQAIAWRIVKKDQGIEDAETRYFIIDSVAGPTSKGQFTITAKDPLSLLDEKRAQAPTLTAGRLASNITSSATTATIQPAGIVAEEYGSQTYSTGSLEPSTTVTAICNIGGEELCAYSRSGNDINLVRGGMLGTFGNYPTPADARDADDRVQVALAFLAVDPADIIYILMTKYANIPTSYIDLDDWRSEVAEFLGRNYTAIITEPTAVKDLINELLEQSAMSLWWDETAQKIRLQVLRQTSNEFVITDDNALAGTLVQTDNPQKRVSQAWTYFGQINPLEGLEDEKNYRSSVRLLSLSSEDNWGSQSIRKIYSRWITQFGRPSAERLNSIIISRYSEPPRTLRFSLLRGENTPLPQLGQGFDVTTFISQNEFGLLEPIKTQSTSVKVSDTAYEVTAEEVIISEDVDPIEPNIKIVTIDNDTNNFNLRNAYLSLYTEAQDGDTVICQIRSNVIVGSSATTAPAFATGDWSSITGVTIKLEVSTGAYIVGRGGNGGSASVDGKNSIAANGGNGGDAISATTPIEINNLGIIGGGGGGGGGAARSAKFGTLGARGFASGGGGGAGYNLSSGGSATAGNYTAPGASGGLETGGSGGTTTYSLSIGGNGGALGQSGTNGETTTASWSFATGTGGAAGRAVVGVSNVTWINQGDVRGAQI